MAETQADTGHKHYTHEKRDVNLRWVAYFGIGLVVLWVGSLLLMGWLFDIFDVERRRVGTPASLLETQPLPPTPRLQASPVQDMQEMRQAENPLLHDYAWVDPSTGIVRIPIDRAIELVVTQGLPDWGMAPEPKQNKTGATDKEQDKTEETRSAGDAHETPLEEPQPKRVEGGS